MEKGFENIPAEDIYIAVLWSPDNENLNPKAQFSEHSSSPPHPPQKKPKPKTRLNLINWRR